MPVQPGSGVPRAQHANTGRAADILFYFIKLSFRVTVRKRKQTYTANEQGSIRQESSSRVRG